MVQFHVPRAVVVAIATGIVAGATYYATNGSGPWAAIAGTIAAAVSAALAYNQQVNPPAQAAPT
jgi:membrane associated rhomboid family serine protease